MHTANLEACARNLEAHDANLEEQRGEQDANGLEPLDWQDLEGWPNGKAPVLKTGG